MDSPPSTIVSESKSCDSSVAATVLPTPPSVSQATPEAVVIDVQDIPDLVLPNPPDDVEKVMYLKSGRLFLCSCSFISTISLLAGLTLFTKTSVNFYWYSGIAVFLGFYMGVSFLINVMGKNFDHDKHQEVLKAHADYVPSVDVFLPCCGEPLSLLANAWKNVSKLDWPNIKVHVLDDSASDAVKQLATDHCFEYICRPDRPTLKKAGNLRFAFSMTSGDFIVIFDADFCPRPDFLKEVMPYFKEDEKIAIMQTPQFFQVRSEQTWVEQAAGSIQELFYRLVENSRDRWGAAICVGTCGTYRRSSLAPFGGTAAIGYSEDVHTGFSVLDAGWKVKYIPVCLAKGTCPSTAPAFFVQQYRWAMGSTTLLCNKKFWTSNLTGMQKLCFLTGMLHFTATAVSPFTNPLPGILLLWIQPESVFYYNTSFALPSLVMSFLILKLWHKQTYGLNAYRLKLVQNYAHLFAVKDKLFDTKLAWVPTGGKITDNRRYNAARLLCAIWTLITIGLVVGGAAWRTAQGHAFWNFIPTLMLVTMNTAFSYSFVFDKK